MGAPAGSGEVSILTWPLETGCLRSSSRNPVIAMVAGDPTECVLIASQVLASGVHVCAAACSGVSLGGSLLGHTAAVSLSPVRIASPDDFTWLPGAPSGKAISTVHDVTLAAASRQRKVGGVISGGKREPSAG